MDYGAFDGRLKVFILPNFDFSKLYTWSPLKGYLVQCRRKLIYYTRTLAKDRYSFCKDCGTRVTGGFPLARDPREISGSTNMGTWTINNCSLAVERRFIRAQARTCGFGPDRVGWKLGCAFGGRVLCICAANDRWPLCAQSVRKSEGFRTRNGFGCKGNLSLCFLQREENV